MSMLVERWEHGSDFAYPDLEPLKKSADAPTSWLPPNASYWHSGRDALHALVQRLKPTRVLFPSFYCQDVLTAAEAVPGVEVRAYPDGPEDVDIDAAAIDLRAGDLLVVTNTYGLRHRSPIRDAPEHVTIIEDHTHNPLSIWARTSTASYAFASLRKWLPIPDGGMLWSPQNIPSIDPTFDERTHARAAAITLNRLTGMLLKQRYLAGEAVSKETYRARLAEGEEAIGRAPQPGAISPLSRALLDLLPATAWHSARARNHRAFTDALGRAAKLTVLSSNDHDDAPFGVVLVFDDAPARSAAVTRLVNERVYPAVLWPIDAARVPGVPLAHVELSRRVLCLHCDHRYSAEDMERVARAVHRSVEGP